MEAFLITSAHIVAFERHLQDEERVRGTIEKYMRDLRAFAAYVGRESVSREALALWKERLIQNGYAPVTINSMLAAVHAFLRFAGWPQFRVRYLRIQRKLFREPARSLSRAEYARLVEAAAARGQARLALLMQTMGATGIRVSEVRYITVEAARSGRAQISLKGKSRTILLPGKLCKRLLAYAQKNKIASGEVFLTRGGRSLNRRQIWHEMKTLCSRSDVAATKVFPHNLRHLFATAFYGTSKDIVRLSDVLGHSSIETTRIYLISTGEEHTQMLERLNLVS